MSSAESAVVLWYTPPEIVQYMVARVDTVLREELDIELGIAHRVDEAYQVVDTHRDHA